MGAAKVWAAIMSSRVTGLERGKSRMALGFRMYNPTLIRQLRRSAPLSALLVVSVFFLAACGGNESPDHGGTSDRAPASDEGPQVKQDTTQAPATMDLAQQVEFARTELSARLGVEGGQLRVLEAEEVRWGDTSLGCPQPDRAYTQVVTAGVLIRLAHGKTVYEYHAGRGGKPFLCEPPAIINPPIRSSAGSPIRGYDDGT